MRISDDMRFPHPVLSQDTEDFASGDFNVEFTVLEAPGTGSLILNYEVALTESAVRELVTSGIASIGCFVSCNDTYFTELLPLSWPKGRCDFQSGALINRVTLQPMIWLNRSLRNWDPGNIHSEFNPPIDLRRGDIVGVAPEHVMSVGQAKFAPLESIFELRRDVSLPEGGIRVDLETDRIGILAAPETFATITALRGRASGKPVVMNAVFLPAVMEVLDVLSVGPDQYDVYRWHRPFTARCDTKGIEITNTISILEAAQLLLDEPASTLALLISDREA